MRRLSVLMVLACSLAVAGEPRISVSYSRFTLPNGLDVILHEDHTVPLVVVNLCYHVGPPTRSRADRLCSSFRAYHVHGLEGRPGRKFDQWLEAAGGDNNANTTDDRTDYFEDVPSNALALPLFLESDRMGFLLDSMTEAKVNAQRDVVKTSAGRHMRMSIRARPILIDENLYRPTIPITGPP